MRVLFYVLQKLRGILPRGHSQQIAFFCGRLGPALSSAATVKTISKGFERAGYFPYSPTQIISNCKLTKSLSYKDHKKIIKKYIPILTKVAQEKGRITESDMNSLKTPISDHQTLEMKLFHYIPKDKRVQNRNRALWLNHTDEIDRRKKYIQDRENKRIASEEKRDIKEYEKKAWSLLLESHLREYGSKMKQTGTKKRPIKVGGTTWKKLHRIRINQLIIRWKNKRHSSQSTFFD